MDYSGDEAGARAVFKRASDIHVSRKPGIHLAFSLFEEKHGNIEEAQTILQDFNHRHPNYSAILLRLIAIERRRLVKEGLLFNICIFLSVKLKRLDGAVRLLRWEDEVDYEFFKLRKNNV